MKKIILNTTHKTRQSTLAFDDFMLTPVKKQYRFGSLFILLLKISDRQIHIFINIVFILFYLSLGKINSICIILATETNDISVSYIILV